VKRSGLRVFGNFWGERSLGYSAGLFRIAYGVLALWTSLGVHLNLQRFYGQEGVMPWARVKHFPEHVYSVLSVAPEDGSWLFGVACVFSVAAFFLTIGFVPRFWSLVIFAINVALQHRNPYVVNGGDRLFGILAALGALLPLGHRWSVDAWIHRKLGREPRQVSVWSQRLIGLQISYIYLFSCFAKLAHAGWWKGNAIYHVVSSQVFAEWPVEITIPLLVPLATWGTLLFEWLFPLAVWLPRYRPYALVLGVAFHVGIDVALVIPMFSAIMVAAYPCYMSDAETVAFVNILLKPLGRRVTMEAPAEVSAGGPTQPAEGPNSSGTRSSHPSSSGPSAPGSLA